MIEINLLPPEHRPKAAVKFEMPQVPVKKTFIFIGVFVIVAQVLLSGLAVYKVMDLSKTKKRVELLESQSIAIARTKSQTDLAGDRLRKLRGILQKKYNWSSLLSGLSNSMTKGVWLTGFSVVDAASINDAQRAVAADPKKTKAADSKALKLTGCVVGPGEETAFIGKFIKELKANPVFTELFSKIELSNFVQKKIREFDVYDFTIYCTLKPEKVIS